MADRYRHSGRIRYGECDMQGVVFDANYMAYVDDAVDTWVRERVGQFEDLGFDFMLKKATFEWQAAATFGTRSTSTSTWVGGATRASTCMSTAPRGRDVFTAVVVYVSVVREKHTPTPVPAEVREALSR